MEKTMRLIEHLEERMGIYIGLMIVCFVMALVFVYLIQRSDSTKSDLIFSLLLIVLFVGFTTSSILYNNTAHHFAYTSDLISGDGVQEKYEAILDEYPNTKVINVNDEDNIDEDSLSFIFFIDKEGNTYIRKDYETIESVEYQNRIENAKEILE